MLEIAIPRRDRPGGTFPRVMVNNACISTAVRGVSHKLIVRIRDAGGLTPAEVRSFVSDLYCQLWDVACTTGRVNLDCRVLLPPEGRRSGITRQFPSSDEVVLMTELEVLYSDAQIDLTTVNANRRDGGAVPLSLIDLKPFVEEAHRQEYFYVEDTDQDIPLFTNVACGGTFDRLHGGHKKLLTVAASLCQNVLTVGVTSDKMLKSKSNYHLLGSLPERMSRVQDFLRSIDPGLQTRVEEILDPFGPPVVELDYDAIVVSSETIQGAEKINEIRQSKGMPELKVVVTRRTVAATLSSTYLREAGA
ncbi:unnamed protein product [Choristocarpus tenellus]